MRDLRPESPLGTAPLATAPAAAAAAAAPLPAWPNAWYVVARSSDLTQGRIVDGRIADRSFVLFRDSQGALVALDAFCPHMGAHLRTGTVVGDRIRCALHHLTIGRDGGLEGLGASDPCSQRKSVAWPTFERFGLVFLYVGRGTAPPPPFADAPDDCMWLTAQPMLLSADWRAVLVNGFDTLHMRTVHQRALVKPPALSRTDDGGFCMRYQTRVLPGGGLSSWLTRQLSADGLRITQICHGPTMLVESKLGRFTSRAAFGLIAQGDRTLAYASFGAPKGGLFRGVRLRLTRALYTAFLRKDFGVIEGMQMTVDGITDPGVKGICDYLRSLPALGAPNGDD